MKSTQHVTVEATHKKFKIAHMIAMFLIIVGTLGAINGFNIAICCLMVFAGLIILPINRFLIWYNHA